MAHYNITIHDRAVDRRNGRKAKGSHWHKGKKKSHGRKIHVSGYRKDDGTYVSGYYRRK